MQLVNSLRYALACHEKDIRILYRQKWIVGKNEKMDTKIETVWNPKFCLQLLNHLQIPANADTMKRYFNRLAKRITQLGFDFEIVTKSLSDIQSHIRSRNMARKVWLSGYYRKQQEESSK